MYYLKKFLYLIVFLFGISANFVLAATSIDHFTLKVSPETAKIGEALDLTIEARDKNDAVVKNYEGGVLILSQTDTDAEFPSVLKDNSYTFKKSDEGIVKFENSIKFKKSGTQDIEVYDIGDDNIVGKATVEITKEASVKGDIEILSPEDGLTIGENKVKLNGKTKKNFQVKIFLNGKESASLNSNDQGTFEKEITNLQPGENIFTAKLLDADNNIIGESKSVKIKVSSNLPKIKSVKITPNKDVETESKLSAELISIKGLSEVTLLMNDVVFKLEEKGEGVYRGTITAPKESGDYRVDGTIKDDLGHVIEELGVETVTVKESIIPLKSGDISVTQSPNSKDIIKKDLKITGLKLIELKTKSILTWDKLSDAYKYNVYKKLKNGELELITTVDKPKFELDINFKVKDLTYEDFYVKAVAKSDTGGIYEGQLSDPTKIQTGPEIYILLILSILIAGFVVYKKNYYKVKA